MSDPIITVENLSKRYNTGKLAAGGDGLRHVFERVVCAPFNWWRPEARARRAKTEEFWAHKDLKARIGQSL